jgi:hypothetical protein
MNLDVAVAEVHELVVVARAPEVERAPDYL